MLDYLIIGQGIAGTLLGYNLLKKGKKIIIVDNEDPKSSSRIAAGIFNPVTGKRKVKTWQADLLFDYLNSFYPELERALDAKFFYPKPIYMLFDSIEEQNHWAGKISDTEYKRLLDINIDPNLYSKFINDPYGGILAKNSGYIDVQNLLQSFRKKAEMESSYLGTTFDYDKLKVSGSEVVYEELKAKNIIFCEGASLTRNKYFSWLPFNLVKGEILLIEVEEIPDLIINKNIFILPVSSRRCIAGATYNWDDTTTDITEAAVTELTEKIELVLKIPYKIIAQKAGIRPATKDRRPYFGVHPEYENLFVFGGLGTKGVSIGPYYAEHFLHYLENGKELNKDVNISRHYPLYYLKNKSL